MHGADKDKFSIVFIPEMAGMFTQRLQIYW